MLSVLLVPVSSEYFLCEHSLFGCQNDRLYAATDGNAVESYLFEDGQPDGVLTRFSSHATHMCFNSAGSAVVVGARYVYIFTVVYVFFQKFFCLDVNLLNYHAASQRLTQVLRFGLWLALCTVKDFVYLVIYFLT